MYQMPSRPLGAIPGAFCATVLEKFVGGSGDPSDFEETIRATIEAYGQGKIQLPKVTRV
jgi:hypothetical protein